MSSSHFPIEVRPAVDRAVAAHARISVRGDDARLVFSPAAFRAWYLAERAEWERQARDRAAAEIARAPEACGRDLAVRLARGEVPPPARRP